MRKLSRGDVNMRFRTKMILIYTTFVFFIALALGIWYQSLSYKQFEANEYQNNTLLARQLVNQLDETIKPMEFVPNYLLSDVEVLNAIRILSREDIKSSLMEKYREEATKAIRLRLQSYYLLSNFRRVIFFNEAGIVVANISTLGIKMNNEITIQDIPWIDELENSRGESILLGPHMDDWQVNDSDVVFSSVKKIQGNNLGYIEVQKDYSKLEELFQLPNHNIQVVAIMDDQRLIYANFDISKEKINELVKVKKLEDKKHLNPFNQKELLSYDTSSETGITVYILENIKVIREDAQYIIQAAFIIAGVFLIVSGIFVFISSNFLSKPIQALIELMEKTHLDNMDLSIEDNEQHNEFKVLNQSYRRLLGRLNQSVISEKKLLLLQSQAQFDLLQTQVNPHFIYNVLNVLSNRGVINGDEKICDMCSSLANMLRYATNTKDSMTTIEAEIEYLKEYFYLLKERYLHKIEYVIEVSDTIKDETVPRVFFQQFVENSIKHGFENVSKTMEIYVHGYEKNGYWYVEIQDNGDGFSENQIETLKKQMAEFRNQILVEHINIELEIGGMGIINTYGRMMLFYKEEFVFEFGNNDEKGAYILVGAPIKDESRDQSV